MSMFVLFFALIVFGFISPITAFAATAPVLGTTGTFGVVSSTYTGNGAATNVTGDVCYTTGPGTFAPVITGGALSTPCTNGGAQATALTTLNTQSCTSIAPAGGALNAAIIGGNPAGTFPPGCYAITGAMVITTGTTITLDATAPGGDGGNVWVFRSTGALTTGASTAGFPSVVLAHSASAANVFWAPSATTLGANFAVSATPTFVGTIIDPAGITLGQFANLLGRALDFQTTVTTNANIITVPTTPTTATLTLVKTITNNNGGTRPLSDFPLTATGPTTITGVSGAGTITSATVTTGTYTLSETTHADYTAGLWTCTNGITVTSSQITLTSGQSTVCTITNDDIAPVLHLRKIVDNTGGGAATNTAWTITATGALGTPTNLSGTTPVDSGGTFKADTYTLAESGAPSGYTASTYSCVKNSGGAVAGNSIVLANGDNATCTITNTYVPATTETITVIKLVVGGTKVVADFPLSVNATPVNSGDTNSFPAPATYTVTEISNSNYTAAFSGGCPSGIVSLTLGNPKVCTITNTYNAPIVPSSSGSGGLSIPTPPLIDVVKVPSPLALPNGPGPVTYTYTLRNIGTVPVSNVTMVGDTCSPIILTSGDLNNDNRLDLNETWIYQCTTTLSKTHTNTVVATGWANGISAVDVASATVVVGAPTIPPLIHVTKIPTPLSLTAKGGMVLYTEKVTNPGAVPLSNVYLTDDKCTPVKYISGDINGDSKLDISETWTYTCSSNLTKTTTNTVTAEGDANGLTAKDFAIATVVVDPTVPKLPNTGFPPEQNTLWNYIINFFKII